MDPSRPEGHVQLARAYRLKGLLNDAARELKLAAPGTSGTLAALYQNVEVDYYLEEGLAAPGAGTPRRCGAGAREGADTRCPPRRRPAESRRGTQAAARPHDKERARTAEMIARRDRPPWPGESPPRMRTRAGRRRPGRRPRLFEDVTARAGIAFVHQSGATPDKYMFETFGSGVAWIDFDNDGFVDLYFVNGAPGAANALYRNNGNGTFTDVTARLRRGRQTAPRPTRPASPSATSTTTDGSISTSPRSARTCSFATSATARSRT